MEKKATLKNVLKACDRDDLDQLKRWKAADGNLPNLMGTTPWKERGSLQEDNWRAQEVAAAAGHLEILKWLVYESGQPLDLTVENSVILVIAARFGQTHILKWLVEDSGQLLDVTLNSNCCLRRAAEYGHLETMQWLVNEAHLASAKNPAFAAAQQIAVDVSDNMNAAIRAAASEKNFREVEWLVNESGQLQKITEAGGVDDILASFENSFRYRFQEFLENEQAARYQAVDQQRQQQLAALDRARDQILVEIKAENLRRIAERRLLQESEVCLRAFESKLVVDFDGCKQLLEKTADTKTRRTKLQ